MTSKNSSRMSDSLVLFSSDDEASDSHYELKQYENLTAMLKGVPPPSSITISKFTVEEMLQKYHENKETFGFGLEPCKTNKSSSNNPVPFLKYLNSSSVSEIIASLAQKVQERYVQMETMSSYDAWCKAKLEASSSAKKRLRMRQGIVGLSPSRRLSHLARRRQFFSSANLQRLTYSENVRQIEIKKNSNREDARKKTVESEKLKSSKRALFLSPESGTPTKYGNSVAVDRRVCSSGSEERKKLPLQERSKKVEVMKWLSQQNFEVDFPRKRLREECANHSVERKRKCPRRSLNFADDDASSNVATSDSNNSADRRSVGSGKLSEIHKNKLLWAISVVLRENNITRKDDHFKNLAAKLFFKCRTNLDEILNSNTAEGTSDKILHFARKIIPSVFEELGIQFRLPSEGNCSMEKNSVHVESQNIDDSKENINRNNVDDRSQCSNRPEGEREFIFKTPRKVNRRIVKSCQKAPKSGSKRKKNVFRRWRSLELLIEDAVQNSMANLKTDGTDADENRVSAENGNDIRAEQNVHSAEANCGILENKVALCAPSSTPCTTSEKIESGDGVDVPANVIPRLPSVDTSVIFSPIPSSVKEENENVMYPSLRADQTNPEETDLFSEENNSLEILNQDEDFKKGIYSANEGGIFSEEYLKKYREESTPLKETTPGVGDNVPGSKTPVPLSPIENSHSVKETTESSHPSVINTNTESPYTRSETRDNCTKTEESFNTTGISLDNKSRIEESEEETDDNDFHSDEIDSKGREALTPESDPRVEKGTYKPRKLVVKKSKPNWKVVRKNSDEAENEPELRLKMRLSHEWEIVCRNSSCSDIGNNSECDTTSVNCSQTSNATDREISSETEVENSSRRSSAQSKCEESVDEDVTKSNNLFEQRIRVPQNDFSFDMINKCNLIVQKAPVSSASPQLENDSTKQLDDVDNSEHGEVSDDKVGGGDGNIDNKLDVRLCNSDVEHRGSCIAEDGAGTIENEELDDNAEDDSLGRNAAQFRKMRSEGNCEKEKVICSEGISREDSPKRRSGEKSSKKGKRERNHSISPEAGFSEKDNISCKRRGELEWGQEDSESGNSSTDSRSNGPERKKRLLSLENYKARKMEEATKSKVSESEFRDEKVFESDGRKIYNIRLKHPIRRHKHKQKHKEHSKERKQRQKRNREKSAEAAEPEVDGISRSQLHSLHQFLNKCSESNQSGMRDGAKMDLMNMGVSDISNSKEVDVQAIVDALSALSNLVSEQIKLENDKMTSQRDSGEEGSKKIKWLDVVSSWCTKNLNSLNQSNDCSLSIHAVDERNATVVKNVSHPSESISNGGNSVSIYQEIANRINPRTNSLKTEQNPVQDCVTTSSSAQTNAVSNTGYCSPGLINTGVNSTRGIPNDIRPFCNDPRTVNFPNYSMHSDIRSQITETSCVTSAFSELRGASDYKFSGESIGMPNSEPIVNLVQFTSQQNSAEETRFDPNYWSTSQHLRGGLSGCGEHGKCYPGMNSSFAQTPYQFSNGYLSGEKASFYQSNLYGVCSNWQIPNDSHHSLNYQQNGYQNPGFYPFQLSNMPYYLNNN